MVEGAHSLTPDLWIHQESVVLIANTHDVWSFTPEFLLVEGIVPDTWQCLSASRGPDEANVHYGSVNWRMTENQLWISVYPRLPCLSVAQFAGCPLCTHHGQTLS